MPMTKTHTHKLKPTFKFSPRTPALHDLDQRAITDPALRDDLTGIINILKYRRAPETQSHRQFCNRVLAPVFGSPDKHGNYFLTVGDAPTTAFMAHHDSVEYVNGRTVLKIDQNLMIGLDAKDKDSSCLGADDGAGIWLILEMIKAQVPGVYFVFADEESGCQGSSAFVARPSADFVLGDVTKVISFDRHDAMGKRSIITHMCGGRTCSDDFAFGLADALDMGYVTDEGGSVTDAMVFDGVANVREVTNLGVFYQEHHTPFETLDFAGLRELRDALIKVDFDALPAAMTQVAKYDMWEQYGPSTAVTDPQDTADMDVLMMESIIEHNVTDVAELLLDLGWDASNLADELELMELPAGWKDY